jgi:hypothetical protein
VHRKFNDYAISEVIGTNLLILITMIMFSLLLTTVFTVIEPEVESPTVDILCQVDEDNILLSHVGGESLSTHVKIIINIGFGTNQEYLVDDYLNDELKEGGWEFGESLVLNTNQIVGNDIIVNLLDVESNSIIFSAIIPSPVPLITFVNSITPYLQSISPLEITATSTGSNPDNVSLWYKWEGYWEDNFENDDSYVLDYHNMSFIFGDYASVNVSGIGQEIEDIVDNDNSDVDGSIDLGSHSDFNNQKLKDDLSDNLTEENTGGGYLSNIFDDSFEGNPWNDNWDDAVSNWYISTLHNHSGINSSSSNNTNDGDFDSNIIDTINADLILVEFWYFLNNTESNDLQIYYFNGASWDLISSIGGGSKNIWLHYVDTISDSNYFISNFKIRFNSNLGNNENVWIDDIIIQKSTPGSENYELDLEIQWLNVNYQLPYEELCIYVTSIDNEGLLIDVWNTTSNSWATLFNDLSIGWNNISVKNFLTSSTFTIRFIDSLKILDTDQDIWGIDFALLHVWEQYGDLFYEGNITSIDITKPIDMNWSYFNANVNNTANSTFKILDDSNNVLLSDLDGLNNDISTIISDTIRLYGSFNGPVKLYSWNVKYGDENWLEYNVDTNGANGWDWSFNFVNGTGLYRFYSIGEKNGWPDEASPIPPDYDAICYYKT